MNTKRAFALVLLVELSVGFVDAQPTSPSAAGVVGQRYVEVSGGQIAASDDLFDRTSVGDVRINVPLPSTFDLNFGYAFSRTSGTSVPGMLSPSASVTTRQNIVQAEATGFVRYDAVTPFIRAAVGYRWLKSERVFPTSRFEQSENDMVWGIGAGAEFLIGRVAIIPAISYQSTQRNEFGNDVGGAIVGGVDAHVWFTRSLGGFVRLETQKPSDGGQRGAGGIGLRCRF